MWLKCVHRSAGHHCCGECVASLCGFTAAASVSAVCFQFCKPRLHLFSLAPPPSSKLTVIGGAAFPPTPTPSLHRKLTVHLAEEVPSDFIAQLPPPPTRFLMSSLDSERPSVRQQQGSALILGGGFWFTVSSALEGGHLLRFLLGKVEAVIQDFELVGWPGYLEVRGCPQPQSSWLCVTRQGMKAECLGGVGFLLLMSLKTTIHTRNGRRCGVALYY